ncbi:MAG: hypothetical protein A2Z72_06060 [Omnitrophica bacterium RBG_13_46_9]|nr:MAG: hypothetical protein A2Z72_06060 [Omnitrophica bacterium RBG_13_46_9]
MEKRLITAIVLSILVILICQSLVPRPKEPMARPVAQKVDIPTIKKDALPTEFAQEPVSYKEKETIIETEKYILTFTDIGGSLKEIRLKEYLDHATGSPLILVSNAVENRAICSIQSDALIKFLYKREFSLIKQDPDKIVYEYLVPGAFKVTKEYNFYKYNDYIELHILIYNLGNITINKDYDILGASGLQSAGLTMGRSFLEATSMIDGKISRTTRIKNGEQLIKGIISWTGIRERYFCIALKPQQESEAVILKQFGKSNIASGVRSKIAPIYAGGITEDSYFLYIGPNIAERLKKITPDLDNIVNYGIFGIITKGLLITLRAFYNVTKNWGVAIIMLTFLINIIVFPLTRKSFLSMKKMQDIQPHMEKLRKLHKDNPQKLNKELAELYRQYNINPLGGCLPLLLQMPVFIALYQGLISSIELKGANFLWIKDLSSPDYIHIPVSLPFLGNQIHILPILMVVAMFFQQRMSTKHTPTTTKEQEQQQKIMLFLFPVFFGFIFYSFPSGLVLYWLTNTILMVVEHSTMKH